MNRRGNTSISKTMFLHGGASENLAMQITVYHNYETSLSMSGHILHIVRKSHAVLTGTVGSEEDR